MHQITQRDPRLHLTLKAHQNRFRHIQWHYPSRGSKRHQTRTCWERNTQWETSMRVTTSTDCIWQ
ncbi:Uncharacterised protein [Vibrio cholerae]|nr:Uncharacterised protein [Vibrio cholerae]CSC91867.1 Uncharacterised protein [Vibrio cholerae]